MTPSPRSLFPANPSVGQQVTAPDGRTWEWDGTRWVLISGGGGGTGGGQNQTPWLSNINADHYSLRNAGQVVVGAANTTPSLICDPSGITWYDRATISGGATPGSLTISTYDLNLGSTITTIRNKPILTTPIESNVDFANFDLSRVSEITMGSAGAGAPALRLSPYSWDWYPPTFGPPMWGASISASEFAINSTTGSGPFQSHTIMKWLRDGRMGIGGDPKSASLLNIHGNLDIDGDFNIGADATFYSAHMGFYRDGFQWYEDWAQRFGVWISPDSEKLEIWRTSDTSYEVALSIDRQTGEIEVPGNFNVGDPNQGHGQIRLLTDEINGYGYASLHITNGDWGANWRCFVDGTGNFRIASGQLTAFEGVIMTMQQHTGDVTFNYAIRCNKLPNFYPGPGTHKLWYDPGDGYTVKFAE